METKETEITEQDVEKCNELYSTLRASRKRKCLT